MRFRSYTATAAAMLFIAFPALSRINVEVSPGGDAPTVTLTCSFDNAGAVRLTNGAPYSGREHIENTQTLADGTHLSRAGVLETATWRDSSGRVRTEQPAPIPAMIVKFTVVEIQDPVAGYRYMLDGVNRVAHRAALQSSVAPFRPMTVPPPGTGRGPQTLADGTVMNDEYIGIQTISGANAVGRRMTITRPAGSFLGNDRPVTTIRESWDDVQTGVQLLWKVTDPAMGDHTTTLQNYSTAEPDPALFQVPPGYRVVDERDKIVVPRSNSR